MSKFGFVITQDTLSFTCEEKSFTISKSHVNYSLVSNGLITGSLTDAGEIEDLMNTKRAILSWSKGDLIITDGEVTYKGMQVNGSMVEKMLGLMQEGQKGFKRFAKFLEKTMKNPSYKTRQRLMEFASAGDITISKNGDIIAYKNVRENGESGRSGRYDEDGEYHADEHYQHFIGAVCEMPREFVDDEEGHTCAHGLHVASFRYLLEAWGTRGITFKVAVNPRDFVAIPPDYKDSKARVCRYKVVSTLTPEEILEITHFTNCN